jgi:adenylate cyclase
VQSPRPRRRAQRIVTATRAINQHPALLRAAKRTRERLLGEDELADRLATARGRPADVAARGLAAYRRREPGVAGELGLTALQVWQSISEHRGRGRGEVDVAVLFTDLVGFSSWALRAGDEQAIELLRKLAAAIEPPVLAQRGEVVKRLGDGLMAVFWDARGAADAAFQAHARAAAVEVGGYRPVLRTGVHVGRPRKIGGDYFGVDVNIAARLLEAAQPGEVLVSDQALRALGGAKVSHARPIAAKGAPPGFVAHVLAPPPGRAV